MSVYKQEIYSDDLKMIAALLEPLEALSAALGDSHHVGGQVRIWNSQGWSPGFFTDTETGWMFTADYAEANS